MEVLRTGTPQEKCAAADRLGERGEEAHAAVDDLISTLQDDCAVEEDIVSGHIQKLEWDYVREHVVRALARIAPQRSAAAVIPILPALARLQKMVVGSGDPDSAMRTYVDLPEDVVTAFGPEAKRVWQEATQAILKS
jgi:hypothetical protein